MKHLLLIYSLAIYTNSYCQNKDGFIEQLDKKLNLTETQIKTIYPTKINNIEYYINNDSVVKIILRTDTADLNIFTDKNSIYLVSIENKIKEKKLIYYKNNQVIKFTIGIQPEEISTSHSSYGNFLIEISRDLLNRYRNFKLDDINRNYNELMKVINQQIDAIDNIKLSQDTLSVIKEHSEHYYEWSIKYYDLKNQTKKIVTLIKTDHSESEKSTYFNNEMPIIEIEKRTTFASQLDYSENQNYFINGKIFRTVVKNNNPLIFENGNLKIEYHLSDNIEDY